ncbi:hypothetical protein DSM104299_02131 [Baekduia alba]|uniref:ADP-ribosylglycohydrolase family protein n=1 Tax=Baekduia alba TaxID=2997333 RepID=UPI00233FDF48|nr:ADP-ribosylglycohydrolase family protein [Baekduia alba]WCB93418.1 hypothetical protein DSM104299_02131 [Baekduia alba]
MATLSDRVLGTVLGLAVGDAAGWPAVRHRAVALPPWTRRLARELDAHAEEQGVTTLPVPFSLNQPPAPLRIGPGDDAEWLAFTAEHVLAAAPPDRATIDAAWAALARRADEPGLRARISVRCALDHLAAGRAAPVSGHDHPHCADDAAALRAPVFGMLAPGDPDAAAALAAVDAAVTNAEDGLHAARAVAAAVAVGVAAGGVEDVVAAALAELPAGTAIRRQADAAVGLGREAATQGGPFAVVPAIDGQLLDHVYSYGVAAADTLPAALALLVAADGALVPAVSAAACLARCADSAPALTGALAGALGGAGAVPTAWRDRVATLAGCCLPELAGRDLHDLGRRLAQRAGTPPTQTTGAVT